MGGDCVFVWVVDEYEVCFILWDVIDWFDRLVLELEILMVNF